MRVFEILDEIIDAVEAAKGVPMSSSAIVNRPALLDLLDDLRDAFPAAVEDAREILEQRDEIVASAREEAARVEESCNTEANRLVEEARKNAERQTAEADDYAKRTIAKTNTDADRILAGAEAEATAIGETARAKADGIVQAAQDQHARLVTDHEVHRSAVSAAEETRLQAEREATKLRSDADQYVEDQLSNLSLTLQKLNATVERGRDAMYGRRSGARTDHYTDDRL